MSVNLEIVEPEDSLMKEDSKDIVKGSWWKSVRVCVVLICFLSVACSAGVTAAIAIVSYEDALMDTRKNGGRNLDSCFEQSQTTLTRVTVDLLTFNAASVSDSVGQMLKSAVIASDIMTNIYVYTNISADKSAWEYMHDQRKLMLFTLESMQVQGLAAVGLSAYEMNGDYIRFFYQFHNAILDETFVSQNKGPPYSASSGRGDIGILTPNDGGLLPSSVFEQLNFEDNFGTREIIRDGIMTPGSPKRWRNILTGFYYSGILLTSLIHDPVSDKIIAIEVSLSLERMSLVLKGIAEVSMANSTGSVYLYTVVRSSPFYERTKQLGLSYPNTRLNEVGYLTAVSNGSVYEVTGENLELLRAEEATDPTIRGIAIGVNESGVNYQQIYDSKQPSVVDSVGVPFIVQVSTITPPEGLDWWLVSAIDLHFIIGSVIEEQETFLKVVAADTKKTGDKIIESQRTMYLVISSFLIVLVCVSALISYRMLLPLAGIQEQMQKVSEMDLDSTETIPTSFYELSAMQNSFEKMVRNLKEFKAYVPTAVLEGSQVMSVIAPPSGDVALVFTDIVSSTALWARAPSAMNDALELHNSCIRKNVHKFEGYEVKTIGDAFMVAFDNPLRAIEFSLSIQLDFVKQKWPSDLDLNPQFDKPTDSIPQWNGLRLRIGCQVGEAVSEENPLTGRADYRGSTVNMAARLESKAVPGTVCISKELHLTLKDKLSQLDSPIVQDHGKHDLKGIGTKDLITLCPSALASRLSSKKFAYEITSPAEGELSGEASSKSHVSQDNMNLRAQRPSRGVPKKTGLSLASSHLTIAVCNLTDTRSGKEFENYNLMLRAAVDAASQTDGVPGNVTGTSLTVIWNATKVCKVHTTAAIRFASQIQWRVGKMAKLGLATGKLLHGNVGNSTQRYHTVFGLPLRAAYAAAELAPALGTFAIVADCTPDNSLISNSAVSPFLRMVDLWLPTESELQIHLFEILGESLSKQIEDGWGLVDSSQTNTDVHNKAFKDVLAGNGEEIEKIKLQMTMSGDDAVLTVCCLFLVFF